MSAGAAHSRGYAAVDTGLFSCTPRHFGAGSTFTGHGTRASMERSIIHKKMGYTSRRLGSSGLHRVLSGLVFMVLALLAPVHMLTQEGQTRSHRRSTPTPATCSTQRARCAGGLHRDPSGLVIMALAILSPVHMVIQKGRTRMADGLPALRRRASTAAGARRGQRQGRGQGRHYGLRPGAYGIKASGAFFGPASATDTGFHGSVTLDPHLPCRRTSRGPGAPSP